MTLFLSGMRSNSESSEAGRIIARGVLQLIFRVSLGVNSCTIFVMSPFCIPTIAEKMHKVSYKCTCNNNKIQNSNSDTKTFN